MTDNELLFIVNSKQYMNSRTPETPYFALRAVLELHKPFTVKDEILCKGCCQNVYLTEYPCPTIQAIEKELV